MDKSKIMKNADSLVSLFTLVSLSFNLTHIVTVLKNEIIHYYSVHLIEFGIKIISHTIFFEGPKTPPKIHLI
ncbi:hypothetical protein BpHYR1_045859 [Brachionus plicatilis]|uniref:Uncharacterized protein n=1 Tax=Brachionus plicatilis TaxID=10195 RepID=A0A3M7RC59_BRAPC|nr:hypothetical protein BpHYR1_045859 [Brachionus plicatilis]